MDKITSGLLKEFRRIQNIDPSYNEATAFEYFSAHLIIGSFVENTTTTNHTVIGKDNQPAVDAIGIIVNGNLIENEDEIESFKDMNGYLDVDFIFIQAKTSENFSTEVLSNLGDFVDDFIREEQSKTDTKAVESIRKMKNSIYNESEFFKKRIPNVYIYYVTTGKTPSKTDNNFNKKIERIVKNVENSACVEKCTINLIGSRDIQDLKRHLENSINRKIQVTRKVALPKAIGIDEAYLGVVPAPEFISLLKGHGDGILSSIFYDNVRDWQGDNDVNSGIAKTLLANEGKTRFVFMNNGITIIAKKITTVGDTVHLEDYQIVNGCQTSNVLWKQRKSLDEQILIPVKIIATTDENVVNDIIQATNSQTQITSSQLLAATEFQKGIEEYFKHQKTPLYYERRSRQFTNAIVDKEKIVTPIGLLKAYASIFLEKPHQTTRDFKSVVDMAGKDIFGKDHKFEIYYMTALAQSWIDFFLRKSHIDKGLVVARFQILLAFKVLNQSEEATSPSSNTTAKWADLLTVCLANEKIALEKLTTASNLVAELLAAKKNKRDAARSSAFTDEVKTAAKKLRSELEGT